MSAGGADGGRDVLRSLREHRADMARFGVRSLAVFGSVARGEARSDSDADILVEFDGPTTLDRYMDLKEYLESLLGRRVDLVTRNALKPVLWSRIEREAIYVS